MKAARVGDLPTEITAACLAHCRKHGNAQARELLRHLREAKAMPASPRSESLLAEMIQGIEDLLRE